MTTEAAFIADRAQERELMAQGCTGTVESGQVVHNNQTCPIHEGRQVKARDLKEGTEILGVGVMEADAEPLGSTHIRLYVEGRIFDKPADSLVSVGD